MINHPFFTFQLSAEKLYSLYFNNDKLKDSKVYDRFIGLEHREKYWQDIPRLNDSLLVSVTGSYGSGKTTVKKELKNKLQSEKCTVIDFCALQFEDKSQITSALYYKIAEKFSCELKNKFRACGVLKKEENIKSISTDQLFFGGLAAGLIFLLSKWYDLLLPKTLASNLQAAILIIFTFLLTIVFIFKDSFVTSIAGILPYKTHVDILDEIKDEFEALREKVKIIILIDEMDRLSPESLKLLLDEILTLHDRLGIYCRIFMFYDEFKIYKLLKHCNIRQPKWYLQKFIESNFMLPKPSFLLELYEGLNKVKYFSNPYLNSSPLEKPFNGCMPSREVLDFIDKGLTSFRDMDRFIMYVQNHGESDLFPSMNYISHGQDFHISLHYNLVILTVYYKFKIQNIGFLDEDTFFTNIQKDILPLLSSLYKLDNINSVINEQLRKIIKRLFITYPYRENEIDNLIKQQIENLTTKSIDEQNNKLINFLFQNLELFDDEMLRVNLLSNPNPYFYDMREEQFIHLVEEIVKRCNYQLIKDIHGLLNSNESYYSRLSAEKCAKIYLNYINLMKYVILRFGNKKKLISLLRNMTDSGYKSIFIIVLCDILNASGDSFNEYSTITRTLSEIDKQEIYLIFNNMLSPHFSLAVDHFTLQSLVYSDKLMVINIDYSLVARKILEELNSNINSIFVLCFWIVNCNIPPNKGGHYSEFRMVLEKAILEFGQINKDKFNTHLSESDKNVWVYLDSFI
ncbi:MAG: NTPase protein [Pseudomonadota bacterium]|nr:NTPase protein [Pseudomonadota bacterium]